jgi:thiol-disulfide isomerase/thioredoxin
MPDVTEPVSPVRFGWRLRLLVVVAVLVTGFTVLGVIETLHYSPGVTGSPAVSKTFFQPKSTVPVPFSLGPLTATGKGRLTSLSEMLGKPLVINLWASTCTVCMTETPAFETVARALGGQVRFLGIDTLDTSLHAGLAFERKYKVTYPQLYDPDGIVATGYGVPGLPVTVFVSAAGKVLGENIGALSVASLRHYLDLLFGVSS